MLWRVATLAVALSSPVAAQDLTGHGGPVGALALADGLTVTGSFDTRAIRWDDAGTARSVFRVHDGSVTAVAILPSGAIATGGQDGRIAIWTDAADRPAHLTDGGFAPVVALSVGPQGLVAAHRDGVVRLLATDGTPRASFQAHRDRITGLGHLTDGTFVTVGADLSFSRWHGDRLVARADLPDLPNGLAMLDDRAAVIFADGSLRLYDPQGTALPERFLTDRPLVAVASGGGNVAAAAVDGTVWLLGGSDLEPRHRLSPGQGPVWALALDARHLLTGGGDGRVLRWSVTTGERLGQGATPGATANHEDGSRGAEVWRACAVCHSLTPDDQNRAGPSLHRIFGRRIGTVPGYDYSASLPQLDIVWTPQTVAALFEYGPTEYTPGSRMPEQRLSDPADRQALVEFLARHTQ